MHEHRGAGGASHRRQLTQRMPMSRMPVSCVRGLVGAQEHWACLLQKRKFGAHVGLGERWARMMMKRLCATAFCVVAIVAGSAGQAVAGEVKGPPGTPNNINETGALKH